MRNLRNQNRSVVVTGLGVVSSLGIGWEEFWKNLLAGKSGISKVTAIDTSKYDHHKAGQVKNFDANKFVSASKAKKLGRASLMAIGAAKLALTDAKLNIADFQNFNGGICLGTTMGEAPLIESIEKTIVDFDSNQIKNIEALTYPANSIVVNVANELRIKGPNMLFATACAAGNYAVGYAYDMIRSGKVNSMLAGGADALSRIAFTGFGRLYAMSPEMCQPFDINRKGMMLGEGAGILVLEEYESAKKRNVPIYAEIAGYGISCDAYAMTDPLVEGVVRAMKKSLKYSKVRPADIGYISAHGTGTVENDRAECSAIKDVFDGLSTQIPVSSIKSMLGHTMGAASAIESIACCLALKFNEIPPTINLKDQDPACAVDCVPNQSRKQSVRIALNNAQAFGGNNACVTYQKFK